MGYRMMSKIKDLHVVSSIPDDLFSEYNRWLEECVG